MGVDRIQQLSPIWTRLEAQVVNLDARREREKKLYI